MGQRELHNQKLAIGTRAMIGTCMQVPGWRLPDCCDGMQHITRRRHSHETPIRQGSPVMAQRLCREVLETGALSPELRGQECVA